MIYRYSLMGLLLIKILINLKSYKNEKIKLCCTDTWLQKFNCFLISSSAFHKLFIS